MGNYDFETKEIKYEESSIGRAESAISKQLEAQVNETRRIADAAQKTANSADIKGWIAVAISFVALILQVIQLLKNVVV